MAEVNPYRRRVLSVVGFALAAGAATWGGLALSSRFSRANSGYITIDRAHLRLIDNRWVFDCHADIDLPSQIQLGLESGVPLQFIVTLKVIEPKQFWKDRVLLSVDYTYRLVYYELTRHYRVQSAETERSTNKRSLLSALDELGLVQAMDVTASVRDAEQLANTRNTRIASVSIKLDERALPMPLQPYFSSEWRLASEEFEWALS